MSKMTLLAKNTKALPKNKKKPILQSEIEKSIKIEWVNLSKWNELTKS